MAPMAEPPRGPLGAIEGRAGVGGVNIVAMAEFIIVSLSVKAESAWIRRLRLLDP